MFPLTCPCQGLSMFSFLSNVSMSVLIIFGTSLGIYKLISIFDSTNERGKLMEAQQIDEQEYKEDLFSSQISESLPDDLSVAFSKAFEDNTCNDFEHVTRNISRSLSL